ncbi:MAG TPA: glycosyl hydrolase family 65 protein [Pelobium sp.]|nr:glycosyl hydrolase family 65 protein [Pelobium sp.]
MKQLFITILLTGFYIGSSAQKLTSNNKNIEKAFNLAVDIVKGNVHDDILAAGGDYGGEWTRDIAINSWNGVSLFYPKVAEKSLWSVTNNKETIGHQYWDKIIWVVAALNHYNVNGDKDFLKQAYICSSNTMKQLENEQFDAKYGLFKGPSVFNDGIAGYPAPIFDSTNSSTFVLDHKNSTDIKCLSTNSVYYGAYQALAKMAKILGENEKQFVEKADALSSSIRTAFYNKKKNTFNYLIDGEGKIDNSQEGLGLSFAVIFGIVKGKAAKKIINNAYISKFGIPSIYPDFPRYSPQKPGRHNNIIWPMVNGFYAKAAIETENFNRFNEELQSLTHLAIDADKGNGDFREIYNPYNGAPFGGWQSGKITYSCKKQTWSATAYIDMILSGIIGMRFNDENSISFQPFMPEGISNIELENVAYRGSNLNISIQGKGNKVKTLMLNGVKVEGNRIADLPQGENQIKIVLN